MIFQSKKFQAAIVGLVVAIGAEFGLELSNDTLLVILSPILAYIAGS